MNTHVTISANTSAVNALHYAYTVLLSFETVDDVYMKENIYTVYGNVIYNLHLYKRGIKKTNVLKQVRIPCLIHIKPVEKQLCEITFAANIVEAYGSNDRKAGRTNEFVAEFLKRFSENLENTEN